MVSIIGWYWTIAPDGDLLVSSRGAALDGQALFDAHALALVALIDRLLWERIIPNR